MAMTYRAVGGSSWAGGGGGGDPSALPPWLQKSLPWLVSVTFHLGLLLILVFVIYATRRALDQDAETEVVIPTSFTDPSITPTPGRTAPGSGGDPSRDAAQNNLKEMLKSDGWSQSNSLQNVAGLLEGQTAQNDMDMIARGSGGSTGAGVAGSGDSGGGPASPYGTPGGGSGGAGFKSSFYGTSGNATRIVYIIDHSGSMMDNFDYLKVETKRSVNQLVPLQFFSVIMVSDTASVVGIPQLQRALPDKQREFIAKLDDYVAEGQNDDLLPPFQEAFEKAFAMHPQLIYFLTDGHFDPRLADVVQQLNRDHKVHINTLAFVNHEASYEDQLQNLAKKNGGVYKFISERDAQGQ
jgi:hypothetical protein